MPMTPDWQKPIGALLDYFHMDDVAPIGYSLGGCLAMRIEFSDVARISRYGPNGDCRRQPVPARWAHDRHRRQQRGWQDDADQVVVPVVRADVRNDQD